MDYDQPQTLLRLKTVIERTGLGRSTIYAAIKDGNFPNSVKLGARCVGWLESELQAWLKTRIEQRNTNLGTGK